MTTAVYNGSGGPAIPAYVWPAVLGVSVAAHLAVILYGLPNMSWKSDQLQASSDTEIIIESGDLVFETAAVVDSVAVEMAQPDALAVEASAEPATTLTPPTGAETPPVSSDAVRPEEIAASNAETVQPQQVDGTSADEGEIAVPEQVEASVAQSVSRTEVQSITATVVERIPEAAPEAVTILSQDAVTSVSPEDVVVVGRADALEVVGAAPVSPLADTGGPGQAVVVTQNAPSASAIVTVPVSTPQPVRPATTAQTQSNPGQVNIASNVQSVAPSASPVAVASNNEATTAVAGGAADTQTVTATEAVSVSSPTPVVTQNAGPGAVQVQTGTVQAVSPVDERLAAIRPSELGLPSIAPSDPEPSSVPAAPTSSDPAANVPPEEIATIDPLANLTSYVAAYEAGECAHLTVMSAGTNSAQVTAFGERIDPFFQFDQRFKTDQGYEADIEVRLVTGSQCALLNAIEASKGVEAAGLVELDNTIVISGSRVSGVIQRDLPLGRIAQAEEAGLELNGKGPPELYLIDDAGQIHDGRSFVRPETSRNRLGGWRFSFPVTLVSGGETQTALILTVWNRPKGNQPAAFGKLPSARIPGVLAKPGVYSLSAFKVSR